MKLSILIPAFNEEQTISDVIDEIPKKIELVDEIEILVVNDGSTDNTVSIAEKKGAKVFSFSHNRGLAKAISYGFSKGIERKSDILVILDADNQYDSKEIPLLIKPILEKKADIVIGNRQVETLDHMPIQKRIGNKLVSKALAHNMIILGSGDQSIRFRPHLNVSIEEIDTALDIIHMCIKDMMN